VTHDIHPDYRLTHREDSHCDWNRDREPAVTVESGAIVEFTCHHANGDRITPTTTTETLPDGPFPGHLLTGPVAVSGSEPGDVLQIDVLAVEIGEWGYTVVHPAGADRGVLPSIAPDGAIYHWEFADGAARFRHREDVTVPITPFPGTIGLPQNEPGAHSTVPPRSVGGNLDIRHLTVGSSLYLPVAVEAGLLSLGDGHAAQGNGEVCVTAIEAPLTVVVEIQNRPDMDIRTPHYRTSSTDQIASSIYSTTGIASDLETAMTEAVDEMVTWIATRYDLTKTEAYVLCSVAGDIEINEVVNTPNVVVSARLPDDVLPQTSE